MDLRTLSLKKRGSPYVREVFDHLKEYGADSDKFMSVSDLPNVARNNVLKNLSSKLKFRISGMDKKWDFYIHKETKLQIIKKGTNYENGKLVNELQSFQRKGNTPTFFPEEKSQEYYELNLVPFGYVHLTRGILTNEVRIKIIQTVLDSFAFKENELFFHYHIWNKNILVKFGEKEEIEDVKIIDWKKLRKEKITNAMRREYSGRILNPENIKLDDFRELKTFPELSGMDTFYEEVLMYYSFLNFKEQRDAAVLSENKKDKVDNSMIQKNKFSNTATMPDLLKGYDLDVTFYVDSKEEQNKFLSQGIKTKLFEEEGFPAPQILQVSIFNKEGGKKQLQSTVSFYIYPKQKVMVISNFFPEFSSSEKLGKGRALLKYLLKFYRGFSFISFAVHPFQLIDAIDDSAKIGEILDFEFFRGYRSLLNLEGSEGKGIKKLYKKINSSNSQDLKEHHKIELLEEIEKSNVYGTIPDKSMVSKKKGGIDLNRDYLNIESQGNAVDMAMFSEGLQSISIESGLVPVIKGIAPVTNLQQLFTQ